MGQGRLSVRLHGKRPDLRRWIGLREEASLDEYLDRISTRPHVQWEQQVEFLYDRDGELMVDFVGRFENFKNDAREVLAQLGCAEVELPHANRSRRGNYRDYYDAGSRERVADMYRADVETFGYKF